MQCRRPLTLSSIAAAAAVVLLAGCGGGGPSGGASVHSSTAATAVTEGGALAFARCMRSHGLTGWPDPTSSGVFDKSTLRRLGYGSGRVRSIEERFCGQLLPDGGGQAPQTAQQKRARVAAALAFARCMRARGFPSFPDPTSQGQLSTEMVTAAGVDLHQPGLLNAGLACVPVTHGLLTRAAIERAVHGG